MDQDPQLQQNTMTEATINRLPSLEYTKSVPQAQITQLEIQVYDILEPIEQIAKYRKICLDRVDAMVPETQYSTSLKWYSRFPILQNSQDKAKAFETPKRGITGIDFYEENQYIGYRFHYYVSEEDFPIIANYLNLAYENDNNNFSHTEIVDKEGRCVTHQLRNCKYRHDVVLHATRDSFSSVPIKYKKQETETPPIVEIPAEDIKEEEVLDLIEGKEEFKKFMHIAASLLSIDEYSLYLNGQEIYRNSDIETKKIKALGPLEIRYNGKEPFTGINFLLTLLYIKLKYPIEIDHLEASCNNSYYLNNFEKLLKTKNLKYDEKMEHEENRDYTVEDKTITLTDEKNLHAFNKGNLHWYLKVPENNYAAVIQELEKIKYAQVLERDLFHFVLKDAHPKWYSYYMHITNQGI